MPHPIMWITDRLRERSSQVAISGALMAIANVASKPEAWAPGCLPLWLGLISTLTPCVIGILVPEGVMSVPWLAPPSPPAPASEDHEAPRGAAAGVADRLHGASWSDTTGGRVMTCHHPALPTPQRIGRDTTGTPGEPARLLPHREGIPLRRSTNLPISRRAAGRKRCQRHAVHAQWVLPGPCCDIQGK